METSFSICPWASLKTGTGFSEVTSWIASVKRKIKTLYLPEDHYSFQTPKMKNYLFLAAAIICETIATSSLKKTEQFSRLLPTVIFVVAMSASFYLLTFALRSIPVGIAYAIWSAAGIVLISIVSYFLYKQSLDTPAILGMALIILGVVVINLFSKSGAH